MSYPEQVCVALYSKLHSAASAHGIAADDPSWATGLPTLLRQVERGGWGDEPGFFSFREEMPPR